VTLKYKKVQKRKAVGIDPLGLANKTSLGRLNHAARTHRYPSPNCLLMKCPCVDTAGRDCESVTWFERFQPRQTSWRTPFIERNACGLPGIVW